MSATPLPTEPMPAPVDPDTFRARLTNVPARLRQLDQWVVWSWAYHDGRLTKEPRQSHRPASKAAVNAPATWSSFDDAVAAVLDPASKAAGVGYVFTAGGGLVGFDLDACLKGGEVLPWARPIIQRLESYAEISPRGNGIKAFVGGHWPGETGRKVVGFGDDKSGGVEAYGQLRFFTVTGDLWDSEAPDILDDQPLIDRIYAEFFPVKVHHEPTARPVLNGLPDDDDLLEKARRAADGDKFRQLFDLGDTTGYGNAEESPHSHADLALCSRIAFWAGRDPERIERLFNRSALVRKKWWTRADYREATIARSMNRDTFHDPNWRPGSNGKGSSVRSVRSVPVIFPEIGEEWEAPVTESEHPATRFPLEAFPAELAALCREGAQSVQCPEDYFAAAALALTGTAIGQSVNIRVKDHWYEPPHLYMAIVGQPGTRKSPAIRKLARPFWDIGHDLTNEYRQALVDWRAGGKEGPAPLRRQITLDDATREAVALIHSENPRGLVLIKDELTGWVASMNAYKPGARGDDKQFYMSINSCSPIKVDRKGGDREKDPIYIGRPCLSVLGGLTPGGLPLIRSGSDDGWIDRILFTYPERYDDSKWSTHEIAEKTLRAWGDAVRSLWARPISRDHTGKVVSPIAPMDDETYALYWQWVERHRAERDGPDFTAGLWGPWSKMEGFCARIVLILSQLHGAYTEPGNPSPYPVDALAVWGACRIADYFKDHFRRARHALSGRFGDMPEDAASVFAWLIADRIRLFTARDLTRRFRSFTDTDKACAVDWLRSRRIIRDCPDPEPNPKGGRPSRAYEVNPSIYHRDGTDRTDGTSGQGE